MAGMTLGQIDSYVRNTLELDATEISDELLHQWVQEGYDHVIEDAVTWRFLDHEWSLATSPSSNVHTFASITDGDGYTPFEVGSLYEAEQGNLERVAHDWARAVYRSTTQLGRPIYWSQWNDSLHLWQRPDQAYTLTVGGYRNKLDWIAVGAGSQPDCPTEFHPLIARWALGLAYAQQDQPDMTVLHHNAVENGVRQMRRKWVKNDSHQPLVLNEGHPTQGRYMATALGRPLFDFE